MAHTRKFKELDRVQDDSGHIGYVVSSDPDNACYHVHLYGGEDGGISSRVCEEDELSHFKG